MEATLYVLKVAGLALAAMWGVLGTIHDYRDKKTGRLTAWGKFAIFGVVFSASIAIVAQVIEESLKQKSTAESARDAAAAAARSESVVNDLARVLQPLRIDSIFVTDIDVPVANPKFGPLKKRFDFLADTYKKRYEQMRLQPMAQGIASSSAHCQNGPSSCEPLSVELSSKHRSFPALGLEAAVFRINTLTLAIYRNPIDPKSFENLVLGSANTPDLYLTFGEITGEPLDLRKEFGTGTYSLTGLLKKGAFNSDSSGRVAAIPDLPGSQIFVRLPSNALPDSMAGFHFGWKARSQILQRDVIPFQQQFELGSVALNIGPRTMWIPKNAWRKVSTATAVYWEYILPADPFAAGPDR